MGFTGVIRQSKHAALVFIFHLMFKKKTANAHVHTCEVWATRCQIRCGVCHKPLLWQGSSAALQRDMSTPVVCLPAAAVFALQADISSRALLKAFCCPAEHAVPLHAQPVPEETLLPGSPALPAHSSHPPPIL